MVCSFESLDARLLICSTNCTVRVFSRINPQYHTSFVMSLIIRPATVSDVGIVVDFVMQLAVYERLEHQVNFQPSQYEDYLFLKKRAPAPEVALAHVSELSEAIGMALFINILPSVIHLEDLFVSSAARGRGAGIALLSHLASLAIERKATSLEWACLDWNEPSLAFYRSIGAVPIENRVLYRITGDALSRTMPTASHVEAIDGSPSVLRLVDGSASLSYTLSFTTFLACPVILIIQMDYTCVESVHVLISHLIQMANENDFKRIDIRIDPSSQQEMAEFLVSEMGAFELSGWIAFSLSGESLEQLARRRTHRP